MTDAVDVALPRFPTPLDTALGNYRTGFAFYDEIAAAIRAYAIQAVMAERERCAKLAEQQNSHGVFIAGLIRAQPEPKA